MEYEGLQVVPLDIPEAILREQEEKQAVIQPKDYNEPLQGSGFESTTAPNASCTYRIRRSIVWIAISLLLVVTAALATGVGVSQSKRR